jgi:multiple antibiotic resistance protein
MMAIQMVSARTASQKLNDKEKRDLDPNEIGIVPLAIPLLAGPGTISQAIIYSNKLQSGAYWLGAMLVVFVIGLFIKFVFQNSRILGKKLGTIGLNVMTRIMGLIILSLSIEIIASGIRDILPALGRL